MKKKQKKKKKHSARLVVLAVRKLGARTRRRFRGKTERFGFEHTGTKVHTFEISGVGHDSGEVFELAQRRHF